MNNITIPLTYKTQILLAAVSIVIAAACSRTESHQAPPPPPTVTVSEPLQEEVPDWDEFIGRFRAIERVEVRARVSGYLEKINFEDGQMVQKGQILFVIDQRPYKIALEQAEASLESAKTRIELAKKEYQRVQNLKSSGAVSQEMLDRREQEFLSARADYSAAKSAVEAARLDLEFTEIKAPVSGKISENFVSVGNLISGGSSSATLLTRIVSLNPIYFTFETSEDQLFKYLRENDKSRRFATAEKGYPIHVKLLDENEYLHEGVFNFIDNEIDQSTGTLKGRAIFQNDDLLLTPGMFGRARFAVNGSEEQLLIPDAAIGSDQSQKYVLVVNDSSMVERKTVEVGSLHNEFRVIHSGLKKTDQVIINGLQKARPGQPVSVSHGDLAFAGKES